MNATKNRLFKFAREIILQSAGIYWILLKISLPLLVVIKILDDEFSVVAVVGGYLSPIMALLGLPGEAGIVWAMAMFLQIYSALLLLASLWTQLELTAAQATILAAVMLVAHALPVELRIAQKSGARPVAMFCARFLGAIILGVMLNLIYNGGDFLQTPAKLSLSPAATKLGWTEWTILQLQNWLFAYFVIVALLIFIKILKITRAERLLIFLLAPLLRFLGIGEKAIAITLIGMTLGLSYGGGLLIEQSKTIDKRDGLCALTLLGLCHSLVEDTLIMLLIGAHLSGILVARLCFALVFTAIVAKIINRLSDKTLLKYIVVPR